MKNCVTNYDPFFDLFFTNERDRKFHNLMKTDIVERKDSYLLKINVPGVKKEDVKISLKEGYLLVEVKLENEFDENDKFIYQERRVGEYSRSYNVGEEVSQEDISAGLENGVLTITIKKSAPKEKKAQYIAIN